MPRSFLTSELKEEKDREENKSKWEGSKISRDCGLPRKKERKI